MTRENAKALLPIIQAYAEGKVIQINQPIVGWKDNNGPLFNGNPSSYRIKPEQKYRPFKDAEECWAEMQKHQPFGWVKRKGNEHYSLITDVDDIKYGISLNERSGFDMDYVWVNYTFADGTPFGIKEEEKL